MGNQGSRDTTTNEDLAFLQDMEAIAAEAEKHTQKVEELQSSIEQLNNKGNQRSRGAKADEALAFLKAMEAMVAEAEKKQAQILSLTRLSAAPSLPPVKASFHGSAAPPLLPRGIESSDNEVLSDYDPYYPPKPGASSSNSRVSSSTPVPVSGAFNTYPPKTTNKHGERYKQFYTGTSPLRTSIAVGYGDYYGANFTHDPNANPYHPSYFHGNPHIHDHKYRASYDSSRAPYYAPPYQNPLPPSTFVSYKSETRITTFVEGEILGREFYKHNVTAFSDFPLDSTRTDFHPAKANHPAPRLLPNPLKHRFLVESDQPEPVATIIGLTTEIFGPTDKEPLQPLVQQQITNPEEYKKFLAMEAELKKELEESKKLEESRTLTDRVSTNPSIPTLIIPNNVEENPTAPQNSKNMNLGAQNFLSFFTALAMTLSPKMSPFILQIVDKFHHSAKEGEVKNTAKVDAPITTSSPSVTPHATGATHTASHQDASKTTPPSTAAIPL